MYLVTKSQVKQIVGDVNIAEDYYQALNIEVESIIKKSLDRMKKNHRRTLMGRDI